MLLSLSLVLSLVSIYDFLFLLFQRNATHRIHHSTQRTMAHSQPDTDKAPLAALSLLSLASASQTTPSSVMQVPRSAATTSVSHMPTVQPYSVQIPPASVPAISPPLSPPYSNRPGAIAGSRGSAVGSQPKARRLSSATQSKRRLSDATAATIQASAASDFVRGTSVMCVSSSTFFSYGRKKLPSHC